MPLRDHFHPPFTKRCQWQSFQAMWTAALSERLNTFMPDEYAAGPLIRTGLGANAAFDPEPLVPEPDAVVGSWHPGPPGRTVEAVWDKLGRFEVAILDRSRGDELVAAIELVSPSNKDNPVNRRLFVNKCAGLLQAGISVVLVDIVTTLEANLYVELLAAVGQSDPAVTDPPQGIYTAACRTRPAKQGEALEAWYHPLAIGGPLPTLPVWLNERLAVPLELEPIYEETLRALRIK